MRLIDHVSCTKKLWYRKGKKELERKKRLEEVKKEMDDHANPAAFLRFVHMRGK
jgi:hypothetical protein